MTQTSFEFRVPPVIHFGPETYKRAQTEASRLSRGRVLLVTDKGVCQSEYVTEVRRILEVAGLVVRVFDEIPGEPTTIDVENGLAALRESGADAVIGVGGGAVLDTAKAIAAMATNPGAISDYMGAGKFKNECLPLIAMSSTAGTGSEVTRVTIITDPDTSVKMLISDPKLIPAVAIDDPLLTETCPKAVTSFSGIDALTHAIEAYASARANGLTDGLALAAIRRISTNIVEAAETGGDLAARTEMLLGSLEAGIAFSNSSVALVHGMARPLGAYFHVPHGLSNAILLPSIMEWSAGCNPRRYADIAGALGAKVEGLSDADAATAGVQVVRTIAKRLGVPTLSAAGVDPAKLEEVVQAMARDALASGSPANNPRVPSEAEIVELYRKAL